MKLFKFFIYILLVIFTLTINISNANNAKIMSVVYDDSASIIYINVENNQAIIDNQSLKCVRLNNPNRVYFDIPDSILIGSKQQLTFEKSNSIKELRISQFTTEPDVVRVVATFEEDFDTSKLKILNINGNIILKTETPNLINDYFNTIYDENPNSTPFSSIVAGAQVINKSSINLNQQQLDKNSLTVVDDIYKAFSSSTLNNSDGKTFDSIVSIDLSSELKLRTKYYINGYYIKNGGLLVSGLGQLTAAKMFTLDNPKRVVIDLPNTYVDKKYRNKELNLCSAQNCSDTAKIGQYEYNKARIVVTTNTPDKYLPIYSSDAQSMLFVNADKLNHTDLVNTVSNIQQTFTKKIDNNTNELIFSFTTPVIHSIVRTDSKLSIFMFNVKSYNEPELIKSLSGTAYKNLTLSLLPQIGVKSELKIHKDDIVQIAQSVDGRALKITIKSSKENKSTDNTNIEQIDKPQKTPIKNKIVIDPGHGGTDYGAIREGINEKDITLDLSQRIASILKSKGYKVAMTRTDDTYLGLQERCDFTENENPEIFISIHVNSAVATEPYGIETHYYHEPSKELAEIIQKHLASDINTKNRGVLKSKFYVINHTDVPAVLVETGFLSNPDERTELLTEKRKKATSKAISEGIIEYLKQINKK